MGDPGRKMINVEVVYALPDEQTLLSLTVADGASVKDAIEQSGILQQFPDLDIEQMKIGLFGKQTTLSQQLREKDRVEIYRPLIADPKEVRKRRAAEGKTLKKGGGDTQTDATKKTSEKR